MIARRIAFLAPASSIHVLRWANGLSDRGHEIHLLSSHPPLPGFDPRVTLHTLPVAAPFGYLLNVPFLWRLLRSIRPDVLHTHFASGYGTLGHLVRFRPSLLSVWGSDVYLFPEQSPARRRILAANLRGADAICATSLSLARRVQELCPDVGDPLITPFGIDTDVFTPRQSLRSDGITVGTVKALHPNYGVDVLIRAFAKSLHAFAEDPPAGNLRLRIVGGGPRRDLERLAGDLGVDTRTTFVGEVPHEQIPDELNRLDVYVAVSRSEGFGVAVLEASACELPVIVSEVGGLPETVRHDVTGIIVEPGNETQTADAIVRLVRDPARRKAMGAAGRRLVLEQYRWSESLRTMESAYEKVLQGDLSGRAR